MGNTYASIHTFGDPEPAVTHGEISSWIHTDGGGSPAIHFRSAESLTRWSDRLTAQVRPRHASTLAALAIEIPEVLCPDLHIYGHDGHAEWQIQLGDVPVADCHIEALASLVEQWGHPETLGNTLRWDLSGVTVAAFNVDTAVFARIFEEVA